MPRIRSIHPEQWCDEDFVELSLAARLLCIAIRNFADDKGIFEWKPKTLKMKVFPADNIEVAALLEELVEHGHCERYEINGKSYGAVRNFRKFQRPKKPNDIYPITEKMRHYVGLSSEMEQPKNADSSGGVPQGFPTGSEIEDQMEDGGCSSIGLDKSKPCAFDEFWNLWPDKKKKDTAQQRWSRISEKEKKSALASMKAGWFEKWRADHKDASPIHASTFLSQKRWQDYQHEEKSKMSPEQIQSMLSSPVPAVREVARKMQEAAE